MTEPKAGETVEDAKPTGSETALGTAMLEAEKRTESTARRLARLVILSDFATNNGSDPLEAARSLKGQGVPVVTVGLGTENAGAGSRDIKLRDIVAGPTVFVKNQLEVRGTHRGPRVRQPDARGRAVRRRPARRRSRRPRSRSPTAPTSIPITGLKYTPQTPGEKQITLKVAKQDGELVVTNNEISTFVTVLSGGLNVLFLQGSNFTWDYKYLMRSIAHVARHPGRGRGDPPARPGRDRARSTTPSSRPGATTSIILSDLPGRLPDRRASRSCWSTP